MAATFRTEFNVQTGERTEIALTPEEIAHAELEAAREAVIVAERKAAADRAAARQTVVDALVDKIQADPTILDRLGASTSR